MVFDAEGHVVLSPSEVQELAFHNPDRLINHGLLPGTPMCFPTYDQYASFVDYLTARTGIHPHHFLFRGSTKLGFSISPNRVRRKVWRRFGPNSDLDLAITDPHFFATIDEQVRRHDRLPENRTRVFRYRTGVEFRKYQSRVDQKGRHDCYRFFDLPRGLNCLAELQEVLNDAPIAQCCRFPFIEFNAFVFRDRWAIHRRYHADLDDLRRELTSVRDPLPQASGEPFPAETPL
jgi:hypothetical protein